MSHLPRSRDFFQFAFSLWDAIGRVQWTPPVMPPSGATTAWTGGLLDGFATVEAPPAPQSFIPDTAGLHGLIDESAAAAWIQARPGYPRLVAQLRKRAGRNTPGRFVDGAAPYHLLVAVAIGLAVYARHLESGLPPDPPGKDDWRNAIAAVDQLKALETKGVDLSDALRVEGPFGTTTSVPFQWLDRLRAALVVASESARKRHVDQFAIERNATRAFAQRMYVQFDEAPPAMVTTFASMIDYTSDSLTKRHLPDWIRQFRTHSLV